MSKLPVAVLACVAPLAVAACGGGSGGASAPDTTAAAVWAHIEAAPYRSWPMWPGREALYRGTEPHGVLLTTYVNQVAHEAITGSAAALPAGAIIVKENYRPDSTLAAVTVMYKAAPGYDPPTDWFWLKRNADGTVEAEGRVAMCAGCHAVRAANDYLYTGYLAQQGR